MGSSSSTSCSEVLGEGKGGGLLLKSQGKGLSPASQEAREGRRGWAEAWAPQVGRVRGGGGAVSQGSGITALRSGCPRRGMPVQLLPPLLLHRPLAPWAPRSLDRRPGAACSPSIHLGKKPGQKGLGAQGPPPAHHASQTDPEAANLRPRSSGRVLGVGSALTCLHPRGNMLPDSAPQAPTG